MSRVLILLALCFLPAIVNAARPVHPVKNPFVVVGKVFCDTCRCGFETSATTYIHGAQVRVECKDRNTLNVVYHADGVTDATELTGSQLQMTTREELCESTLVSSPQTDCSQDTRA
ncbi:hypothetical protein NE237_014276 [Protea cynaroides]|uniref:Uncharacterized protein n=1 Tax=Protea cynaroides TaxID=273540 RepID=A0A9Q0JS45_9MAGN|nr:hypothetical protein NE237_014276 [Protea cynaroides]